MGLRHRIETLAAEFSLGILAAIRQAPLQEILAETRQTGGAGVARGAAQEEKASARTKGARGRLARRSPEQVAKVIDAVVAELKKNESGLRSEGLQKALGLDKKEISRPLLEALAARKISKKGQKRATTYFAR